MAWYTNDDVGNDACLGVDDFSNDCVVLKPGSNVADNGFREAWCGPWERREVCGVIS